MTVAKVLVEACVESVDEALSAERGGADRLELCANMEVGGTTPSLELFRAVRERTKLPIAAMVRPRGGSFLYSNDELDSMRRDIDTMLSVGADIIVLGVLDHVHAVDFERTRELVGRAGDTPVTFHKAFDAARDQLTGLDALIDAGVARVLTSGGPHPALEGADQLARLVERSAGRVAIMAGGSVRGPNAREIVERSGVREVHARCNAEEARIRDIVRALT